MNFWTFVNEEWYNQRKQIYGLEGTKQSGSPS